MLNNKKTILGIIVAFMLTVLLIPYKPILADSIKFTDVKESNWFYKDVMKLIEKGLISGYPDRTFKPNAQIHVDEFIKILITSIDGDIKVSKTGYWADSYINKAKELGIIKDGEFKDYTKNITRGEMARMIIRVAELNGDTQYNNLENFRYIIPDYNNIKADLQDYVTKAYAKGLISGYEDKSFGANDFATRAQASAIIIRLTDESKRPQVDATVVPRFKLVYNEVCSNDKKYWIAVVKDTSIPFDIINQHIWQRNYPECITHPINDYQQVLPNLYESGYNTSIYKYDSDEYAHISYASSAMLDIIKEGYYKRTFAGGGIPYYCFDKNPVIAYLKPVELKEGTEVEYKITLRRVKPSVISKPKLEEMIKDEINKRTVIENFVNGLKDSDFDYYTVYLKGKLPKFEPENTNQRLKNLKNVY
ncbi:S-layer family protein [Tissierella praeacuta]|uniref:S-layer homology domain-containing protein n=1 Tax=Tissierella praeacuta TaxID=43131 RepID=UPI00104401C8|nr:S-layer homology domain-containing protein [Tissierella praeacuta]TCU79333.1 S-layer family protein [Tissierella praeacuta]